MNLIHSPRFFRSLDRFLREQGKQYRILNDIQFSKAREALASKRNQLRRSCKGQKPNKALGLTTTQIQQLWDANQLGDHFPKSLLRTVWFLDTIHFGWRARDENRRAKLGGFQIKKEDGPDGKEYIEWVTEREAKLTLASRNLFLIGHSSQTCTQLEDRAVQFLFSRRTCPDGVQKWEVQTIHFIWRTSRIP